MTDEQILAVLEDVMRKQGQEVKRLPPGWLNFARALLAASAPSPSNKQEATKAHAIDCEYIQNDSPLVACTCGFDNPSDKQDAVEIGARECLADVVSHYRALYAGLAFQLNEAVNSDNSDDATYWKHEIKALERMYLQAESALAAPLAQSAEQDRIDAEYREVGVWDTDGRKFRTYAADNLNGKAMYVRDAAMQADKERQ